MQRDVSGNHDPESGRFPEKETSQGMKTVLIIEGTEKDLGPVQALLRAHGFCAGEIGENAYREEAEKSDREKRYFQSVFENAPVGIFRTTLEGKLIRANPAVAFMLKYESPEEMIRVVNRTNIAETVYEDPARREEVLRSVLRDRDWKIHNERFRCKDGEVILCNFHLRAVSGEDGRVELDGFIENISERKRIEEKLSRTTEMFRAIIHAAPTAIIGLDLQGRVQNVWNPAAERMLGWSSEEVMGRLLPTISENKTQEFRVLREWIAGGKTLHGLEVRRQRKDGTPVEYSIYASPLRDESDHIVGNMAVLVDITERKRDEKKIRDSLAEKEVLLKEIHHRVKNNLQVVSSLLFLQSRKINDSELAEYFVESQSRIYSMALAHELLYQSENLCEVHLPAYVKNLVRQVEQAFRPKGKSLTCRVEVDEIKLDIEQVIPCGLLITELFSNALKHAFPGDKSGTIEVKLQRQGGSLCLRVTDDGIGVPEGLDFSSAQTLGLQLIQALTVQLDGKLEQEDGNGTRIRVVFPSQHDKDRHL
jgi:PAS domain S-box-containing protein